MRRLALLLLAACSTSDGPSSPPDAAHRLRLALGAGVVANAGAVLDATLSYTRAGSEDRVIVAHDSTVVATVGGQVTLTLSADIGGCLREASPDGGASCTMNLALVLTRDGRLLDQSSQPFVVTRSTQHLDVPAVDLFEVATVRITPTTVGALEPGDAATFTAAAFDRSGAPVSGRAATWQVVSGGVTVSAAGEVRAVTPGPAVIRAQIGGRSSADLQFAVGPSTVDRIDLAPLDTLLTVGGGVAYRPLVRATNGTVLAGRPITFTSANPAVATVTAAGVATAVAPGQTVITATSTEGRGGSTIVGSTTLRVQAAPVIVAEPSALSFDTESGQPLPAAGTVTLRNGGSGTLGTLSLVGSVPELSVTLTPTSTGATLTVRPLAAQPAGTVLTRTLQVHSSTAGVADVPVTVTVRGGVTPVAAVTIMPNGATLTVGGTVQLTAVPRDAAGSALAGRTVTWSTSNAAVATVNAAGLVTAVGGGTAAITATSETRSAQVTVTVAQVPVATVSVSLAANPLPQGATTQATAVTRDANNATLTGRDVAWSSSNSAVATVNAATGLVTAIAPGTASITATSEGKTGSAQLTVTSVPVASVSVTLGASTLTVGGTTQGTAVIRDANNNVLTGRTVFWTTSNSAVATVSSTGLVTAVGAGTVNIVATSEGIAGTAPLTVGGVPVASVTVSLGATSILVRATTQATAVTRDAAGAVLTGRTVVWSSSNSTVATVDPQTGVVTGVAAGTVNIIATSENRTGSASLTVTSTPPPVATVTVTLTDSTLFVDQTAKGTAVTRDTLGNILTGRLVTWSTSNRAIAVVDTSGTVTALSPGTVIITATSEGRSGSVTVTVFGGDMFYLLPDLP